MRLATFNVLHGRSPRDGRVDGPRLAAAVAALDADVLGLQEVDVGQERSGGLDLTAVAARAMGARAHRFAAALVGTPGGRYRPLAHEEDGAGEPRFGVGLASRWPVVSWQVARLRAAPVRALLPGPGGRLILLRDEPRAVLAAVLSGPEGPLTVATTHLSFVPGWNAWQLRAVVRLLRRLPAPRVLLGDLNMPAGVARAASGWRPLARCRTFPAARPRAQLDHVLVDPRGLAGRPTVRGVDTPRVDLSDHRPLVVTVDWPPVPGAPGRVVAAPQPPQNDIM